jgi:hypothetical protein
LLTWHHISIIPLLRVGVNLYQKNIVYFHPVTHYYKSPQYDYKQDMQDKIVALPKVAKSFLHPAIIVMVVAAGKLIFE